MPSPKILECAKELAKRKLTIAFAESASAGRFCYEFSGVPESGEILKGGLVCYDASLKTNILGVPEELIKKYTPESPQVTKALAERLGKLIPSSIQVAITGLTTAGGSETPEKPVGTMFIHIKIDGTSIKHRQIFAGNPEAIILQTIDRTAHLILDSISSMGK